MNKTQKNHYQETENGFKCDLRHVHISGIHLCIWILILISFISTSQALKLPNEYDDNQCELIAKDYQREFGGDLIFIQPLKDNGAYDLGDYNGHWLNRVWNNNQGSFYFDYYSQTYFQSVDAIKAWYHMMNDKESEVFNVNQGGRPPFAIYWHY